MEGTIGKLMQQFILGWAKFYDTFETQTTQQGGFRAHEMNVFLARHMFYHSAKLIWQSDFHVILGAECAVQFFPSACDLQVFCFGKTRYEGKEWMGRNPEHFGQPNIPCA